MHTQGKNGEAKQIRKRTTLRKCKGKRNYDSSETPESAGAYCTLTAVKYYWAKAEKAVSLS